MFVDDIANALAGIGAAPSTTNAHLLALHLSLVLEANAEMNLTSVSDPAAAVWTHIVDSALGLPEVQSAPPGEMADIGSGAGYPGVPLAILTGRRVTLIESVKKKARFLAYVLERLQIEGEVRAERAEEVAAREPHRFELVTARAVASLPSLVELAAPLLSGAGRFVAYKGCPSEEEIGRGDRAAAFVGLKMSSVRESDLPGPEPATRTFVCYSVAGPAKLRLPRRPGVAQRHPLG